MLRKDVTQEVRSFLVLSERNERHEVFRFVCRNWRLSTGVNSCQGHECIGFCEIDKFARKSYKAIYETEGEIEFHDIRQVTDQDFRQLRGQVDIICGGFPCQAFSLAGRRLGFEDTRGTLFFEIARAAKQVQPRFLFLENVKGLLSHDKGETFRTILTTLDELGYDVEWQVLNSKDFQVPQNRERIFIIGYSRRYRPRFLFPLRGENSPAILAQVFLIYWEGNSGDKLLERQTRATEWYYQIEKGFSQPNGGIAQSDPKALEAVRGDLYDNSIPGGGDGMGYAYGQCTWGVAARINQLGLKLKGRNGEKIPIISTMGNGQDWAATAARLGGETGKIPKAGAIISFAGGGHGSPTEYGHVAFVEKVYPDGSFLISETNYNGNPNYTFRKLSGVDGTISFAYTTK